MSTPTVMKLHVEGWRRINHSYALVNRNHLRWLLKDPRLSITHREMPYFKAHWAANPNHSFPAAFEAVLNLPDQDAPPDVDITLRMDFPHRFDKPARGKLVVFGTTEYTHISPENLRGDVVAAVSDPEVFILTPSQWSAQGFLKLGFSKSVFGSCRMGSIRSTFASRPWKKRHATVRSWGLIKPRRFSGLMWVYSVVPNTTSLPRAGLSKRCGKSILSVMSTSGGAS